MFDDLNYFVKILLISVTASYISFSKNSEHKVTFFFNRLVEGVFCGYIAYLTAFHYLQDINISLAICGVGAFFGVQIFDFIRDFLDKFLNKKIDKDL